MKPKSGHTVTGAAIQTFPDSAYKFITDILKKKRRVRKMYKLCSILFMIVAVASVMIATWHAPFIWRAIECLLSGLMISYVGYEIYHKEGLFE